TGSGDPLSSVSASATPSGSEWELRGTKAVVLDGHTADVAIVAARTAEGLAAFSLEQPRGELVPTLDVTRKVARVDLDGRRARRIGPAGDQTAALARVGDDIAVALCAETVGAGERALQMAIDYSKQRVQFGRPIATFQAIKHKIVDMLHQLELARVGTHWAAWTSQVDDPIRESAAAACKAFVAEAATMVTAENIQVHGGVGFTWDVDCHLLFRRVKQNDVLFGSQSWNRRRLADLVLGPA
ncbi:MAG: acyl-CoA dehydrogenase family protein, partial [Actinomycetes bacterium]